MFLIKILQTVKFNKIKLSNNTKIYCFYFKEFFEKIKYMLRYS